MSRIYLDSSALLKRAFAEIYSVELGAALDAAVEEGAQLVSSALARAEISRTVRTRMDAEHPRAIGEAASEALSGVAVAQLTAPILESSRIIGPTALRTLDAIHLASAIALACDELWTYDDRMARIADELGLLVRMPGNEAFTSAFVQQPESE